MWQNIIRTPIDWPQKKVQFLLFKKKNYLKNINLYPLILILIVFYLLDSLFGNLEIHIHVNSLSEILSAVTTFLKSLLNLHPVFYLLDSLFRNLEIHIHVDSLSEILPAVTTFLKSLLNLHPVWMCILLA